MSFYEHVVFYTNFSWLIILYLTTLCGVQQQGLGQNGMDIFELNELKDAYSLKTHLYIYTDVLDTVSIDQLKDNNSTFTFIRFDESLKLNTRYTYWIRFQIKATDNFKYQFNDWKLFLGDADYSTVYAINEKGQIVIEKKSGNFLSGLQKRTPIWK